METRLLHNLRIEAREMTRYRFLGQARSLLKIARHLRGNPALMMQRYIGLRGPRKFSASEVFSLGFLDPKFSRDELAKYCSKEQAWPIYETLNRHDDLILLNDKARFHERCDSLSLPILRCAAVLLREDILHLRAQIAQGEFAGFDSLLARLPERFVAKPSFSYQGHGIQFFNKDRDGLALMGGGRQLPDTFVEGLWASFDAPEPGGQGSARGDQSVMLQQVGLAHPSVAALSGQEIMQSLRICTVVDGMGEASILFAFMKIIAGDNLIDNFQKGATGNLIAYVDEMSGRVHKVIGNDPKLGIIRTLTHHPDTRAALIGFHVPFWTEACALALRAAAGFRNTRAVGWDIGITPYGPVLLEGNGTWDPIAPLYRPLPSLSNNPRTPASGALGGLASNSADCASR